MTAPVQSFALKILNFSHIDKSNTSSESVKTLRLFVCTHNNNKTWHFCKIMKAILMRLMPSRSVNLSAKHHPCHTDIKDASKE